MNRSWTSLLMNRRETWARTTLKYQIPWLNKTLIICSREVPMRPCVKVNTTNWMCSSIVHPNVKINIYIYITACYLSSVLTICYFLFYFFGSRLFFRLMFFFLRNCLSFNSCRFFVAATFCHFQYFLGGAYFQLLCLFTINIFICNL